MGGPPGSDLCGSFAVIVSVSLRHGRAGVSRDDALKYAQRMLATLGPPPAAAPMLSPQMYYDLYVSSPPLNWWFVWEGGSDLHGGGSDTLASSGSLFCLARISSGRQLIKERLLAAEQVQQLL